MLQQFGDKKSAAIFEVAGITLSVSDMILLKLLSFSKGEITFTDKKYNLERDINTALTRSHLQSYVSVTKVFAPPSEVIVIFGQSRKTVILRIAGRMC